MLAIHWHMPYVCGAGACAARCRACYNALSPSGSSHGPGICLCVTLLGSDQTARRTSCHLLHTYVRCASDLEHSASFKICRLQGIQNRTSVAQGLDGLISSNWPDPHPSQAARLAQRCPCLLRAMAAVCNAATTAAPTVATASCARVTQCVLQSNLHERHACMHGMETST
jgi:hypothetical protein